ncbi:hypothetical protein Tco_1226075 [Tanacetum coccineum]
MVQWRRDHRGNTGNHRRDHRSIGGGKAGRVARPGQVGSLGPGQVGLGGSGRVLGWVRSGLGPGASHCGSNVSTVVAVVVERGVEGRNLQFRDNHKDDLSSVAKVPSASTLQILRRLKSIFTSVYETIQKLKKDSWLELQFSLADISKLNVVYLLNRS